MYYVLVTILGLLIFVLFLKALGSVLKSIFTMLFVVAGISAIVIMVKSLTNPVTVFGVYKVDNLVITKIK
ncbi:hypothetical protein GYA37_00855 [candidate division WWE3 bacterium]|uniref:Uncharacterized protein n=1 Tax=candidate division WWE3 bacterium TaxID=2053526 RepID=A0A7X9E6T4_UNCKA|nr:hypothetical protein [candidate division WWE3 bacterium]